MSIDFDSRIDWKSFYAGFLHSLKGRGSNLAAKCPFHEDKQASLSVNIENGMWKCHACNEEGNAQTFLQKHLGVSKEEALKRLKKEAGIEDRQPSLKLTTEEYSRIKKLPIEFLEALGFKDGKTGVQIPYYDEAGKVVATRYRHSASATGPRFTWTKGSKLMFYGLWKLKEIRSEGYVVLVEGESDAQTLWYHNIPALGVPGATNFRPEWAQFLKGLKVYIHQEPDDGGELFVRKTCECLAEARFNGEVYAFSVLGHKDPSELHCAGPEQFSEKWAISFGGSRQMDITSMVVKPEELLPGAPIQLRIPAGWRLNEKGVFQYIEKQDGMINVCPVPLMLSRRLRSIDTGEEKMELAFKRDDTWHKISAQRSTVFQNSKITMLADRGLTITSENSKKLVTFLGELEAANLDIIPVVRSSGHLGWVGSDKFIPGLAGDIVLDIDPKMQSIVDSFHQSGSYETWKREIGEYRKYPIARFIIAAGFASPMLDPLKHRVFGIHSWSESKGGKSAVLKAAMSIWGDPEGLMVNFNATKVGLERIAGLYADLPLGVNERQAAGDRQQFIEALVYMLGEGKGKIRGAKGGGLQSVQSWRLITLTTGEEPLSTDTSHTGVKTRVLEIWGNPLPTEQEGSKLHNIVDQNYGWAGVDFVKKLVEIIKSGELKTNYEAFKTYMETNFLDKLGSHITAVTIVCLADYYASQWIFGTPEELSYIESLELAKLILDNNESLEEADYANRALDWIYSWIVQHMANFTSKGQDKYGEIRHELGEIYILPSVLDPALKNAGFVPKRVYQELASRKFIIPDKDKKRYKKTVRIDSQLVKVIALKMTQNIQF